LLLLDLLLVLKEDCSTLVIGDSQLLYGH